MTLDKFIRAVENFKNDLLSDDELEELRNKFENILNENNLSKFEFESILSSIEDTSERLQLTYIHGYEELKESFEKLLDK